VPVLVQTRVSRSTTVRGRSTRASSQRWHPQRSQEDLLRVCHNTECHRTAFVDDAHAEMQQRPRNRRLEVSVKASEYRAHFDIRPLTDEPAAAACGKPAFSAPAGRRDRNLSNRLSVGMTASGRTPGSSMSTSNGSCCTDIANAASACTPVADPDLDLVAALGEHPNFDGLVAAPIHRGMSGPRMTASHPPLEEKITLARTNAATQQDPLMSFLEKKLSK